MVFSEEDGPPITAHMLARSSMHIESLMFVVLSRSFWVGWTGLGWATPGGGHARIRSHRPEMGVGGSRQVIMRTALQGASAGYWVRLPPGSYVDSIIPLSSLKGKGQLTPPQQSGRRQMELTSAAQLDDPTVGPGVCNTTYIVVYQHTQPDMGGS